FMLAHYHRAMVNGPGFNFRRRLGVLKDESLLQPIVLCRAIGRLREIDIHRFSPITPWFAPVVIRVSAEQKGEQKNGRPKRERDPVFPNECDEAISKRWTAGGDRVAFLVTPDILPHLPNTGVPPSRVRLQGLKCDRLEILVDGPIDPARPNRHMIPQLLQVVEKVPA